MFEAKSIKIHNSNRHQKKKSEREGLNHLTPKKYLDKNSMYRKVNKLQYKLNYNTADMQEPKALKYMREEFLNNTLSYYGKGEWTHKLGRKDKYEKNLEHGKPLKQNPILKIFNRIQNKLRMGTSECFEIMKQKYTDQQ